MLELFCYCASGRALVKAREREQQALFANGGRLDFE
jgi:hypothetical protein